jgi:hypothetical protein
MSSNPSTILKIVFVSLLAIYYNIQSKDIVVFYGKSLQL